MANKKISELSAISSLTGTEVFPVVQSGITSQITSANLRAYVATDTYVRNHANAAFDTANSSVAVNLTQNNSITVALNTANAAFLAANNATDTYVRNHANAAFDTANGAVAVNLTQNNSIAAVFLQSNNNVGVDLTQNNSITAAFTRANNSLNANTGGQITGDVIVVGNVTSNSLTTTGTNGSITGANAIFTNYIFAANGNVDLYIYTTNAYNQANAATSTDTTQNNSIAAAFAAANAATATNITQNNSITASFAHANAAFTAANNTISKTTGSWTVTTGTNTYSFSVPESNTYLLWVDCNIPNGILAWSAIATITNTNVPVVGQQFAWVYSGGGTPVDFTSIPNQFTGTSNTIVRSSVAPSTTTNRFDFGINNSSGGNITVRYGWITIS